jgi:predicted enzyme related to lactoylglutathione lyase
MTGKLNFMILHVRDMAAARAFYTEKLGLGVVAESPAFIQFEAAGGAGSFSLQADEHATPTQSIELWWEVEDVDAEYKTLAGRGVEIASEPQDQPFGRTLSIKDPEGNVLNFYKLRQG